MTNQLQLYKIGSLLSDKDIKEALKNKELIITGHKPLYIGSSSIDLHLSNVAKVLADNDESWYLDIREKETINFKKWKFKKLIIYPNDFYIVSTKEKITFPNNIAGFLQGRSSMGRMGLNVHCAGYFDVGFSGTATLELTNFTKRPIILYSGMRICQMVFIRTESPAQISYAQKKDSKYLNQVEPEESQIYKDE